MSSPSRWPSLFPPCIYELTYRMLEHAVHAELADLAIINLTESADTCQLIVDQCIALADCILDRRTSPPWPPTEKVIRDLLPIGFALAKYAEHGPGTMESPLPTQGRAY